MEYRLSYCFKGKHYFIQENVAQKALLEQLEAVVEGLALTSAERNHHLLYGEYIDLRLFEEDRLVWSAAKRVITKHNAYTQYC